MRMPLLEDDGPAPRTVELDLCRLCEAHAKVRASGPQGALYRSHTVLRPILNLESGGPRGPPGLPGDPHFAFHQVKFGVFTRLQTSKYF